MSWHSLRGTEELLLEGSLGPSSEGRCFATFRSAPLTILLFGVFFFRECLQSLLRTGLRVFLLREMVGFAVVGSNGS